MRGGDQRKMAAFVGAMYLIFFAVGIFSGFTVNNLSKNAIVTDMSKNVVFYQGRYVRGYAKHSTKEYCTYINAISFIPVSTEHYYLIVSDDLKQAITVRADKDWEKEFNEGNSVNKDGKLFEGHIKRLDRKVASKLSNVIAQYKEKNLEIDVNPNLYIDLCATKYATRMLIAGIVGILITIFYIIDTFRSYTAEDEILNWKFDSPEKIKTFVLVGIQMVCLVIMAINWMIL